MLEITTERYLISPDQVDMSATYTVDRATNELLRIESTTTGNPWRFEHSFAYGARR